MVEPGGEPHVRERPGGALDSVTAGEFERQSHILDRGHRWDQMEGLEYDADVAATKPCEGVLVEGIERGAVEHHLSAVRTLEAGHHHQKGGLAGARRPDQADRFALCRRAG